MDLPSDDVVRSYGECINQSHSQPEPLSLPDNHPPPYEIHTQRISARLSEGEAAEACAVKKMQWRRWETGKTNMPRPTWAWFKIYTTGAQVAGGPEWEGWNFHKGKLFSPEDWGGFTAGELRTWPYLHALISELRRKITKLEEALDQAQKPISQRDIAIGQIDILGIITAQLMREYEDNDDPLLQQTSNKLYGVMLEACRAKIPLVQE